MSRTRSTVYLSAARITGILVQVVSVPIVWDVLGSARFGVCLFLVAICRWIGLIDIGFLDGCQRQMTLAFDKEDNDNGFTIWNTYKLTVVFYALVGGVIFYALHWFIVIPEIAESASLFATAGALFAAQYLYGGATIFFNSRRQFQRLAISNGVQNLLSGLLALFFTVQFETPQLYLLGFVIGNGLIAMINTFSIHNQALGARPRSFDKTVFCEALRFGVRLYPTRAATIASQTIDRVLVSGVLGSETLAQYGSAARIPEAGSEALPLNQTLMPDLTKAHADGSQKFSSEVERLSRVALMIGCGLIFIPCAFADPLLRAWLGDKYMPEMAWVMVAIGLYRALETFFSSLAMSMIAHGSPQRLMPFTLYGAAMILALIYPAASIYGIIGVAFARVLVHISQFVPLMAFTQKHIASEINLFLWIRKSAGTVAVALCLGALAVLSWGFDFILDMPLIALAVVPFFVAGFFVTVDWMRLAPVPDAIKNRVPWAFRS